MVSQVKIVPVATLGFVDERYQLGSVPKRLRRRVNTVAFVVFVGLGFLFLVGVSVVEGMRPRPMTWLVLGAAVVLAGGVVVLILRTLSPADRATIERAEHRSLPPLPPPDAAPVLRVELHPGFLWRRRLDDRHREWPDGRTLIADGSGLTIPGWLFHQPPRDLDRFAAQHLAWANITSFRVQADSDGPDVYAIEVTSGAARPARWRVRRREVTDEIALLDHVRSVGSLTIDLEASVTPT